VPTCEGEKTAHKDSLRDTIQEAYPLVSLCYNYCFIYTTENYVLPLIWWWAIWPILLNVHSKKANIYSFNFLKSKDGLWRVRKSWWSIWETSAHCRFDLCYFFRTWQNSYGHYPITAAIFYNTLSMKKGVYTIF